MERDHLDAARSTASSDLDHTVAASDHAASPGAYARTPASRLGYPGTHAVVGCIRFWDDHVIPGPRLDAGWFARTVPGFRPDFQHVHPASVPPARAFL